MSANNSAAGPGHREQAFAIYTSAAALLMTPQQKEYFSQLHQWVANESPTVIREVIVFGLQYISQDEDAELQCKGMTILANLSYNMDEYALLICKIGALPFMLRLLQSQNSRIAERAIDALGHLAGLDLAVRDYLVDREFVQHVCKFKVERSESLIHVVRALLQVCRYAEPLPTGIGQLTYYTLVQLIALSQPEVLNSVCTAINDLTGQGHRFFVVDQSHLMDRIMQLLKHSEEGIQYLALTNVANMMLANGWHVNLLLRNGVLDQLRLLLHHPSERIRRLACQAVANLINLSTNAVQKVMSADLLPGVIHNLKMGYLEAIRVVQNAFAMFDEQQAALLLAAGVMDPLKACLDSADAQNVIETLGAIRTMLEKTAATTGTVQTFRQNDGVNKLKGLRHHTNAAVKYLAVLVLITFYGDQFSAVVPKPKL